MASIVSCDHCGTSRDIEAKSASLGISNGITRTKVCIEIKGSQIESCKDMDLCSTCITAVSEKMKKHLEDLFRFEPTTQQVQKQKEKM